MLRYHEVFSPSIAPFKRGAVRDRVDVASDAGADTPMLSVSDAARLRVPIGERVPPSDWLRFRGEIRVESAAAGAIPLPSPAPEGIVTGAFTDPPMPFRFERDGADNWWVVLEAPGTARLVWDVAVSQSYFGGPLPDGPAWDGTTRGPFGEQVPLVASHVGITPGASHRAVVAQLAAWFRGFSGGSIRRSATGLDSRYLDVALGEVGVCRHRAIAFVVTAQAMGIEARYVHNEAHAFAEVRIDGMWRRIDLGGDADGLEVVGGGEPLADIDDGLPSTPEYEEQNRRMRAGPVSAPPGGSTSDGGAGSMPGGANGSGDRIGDGPSPWDEPEFEGSAFEHDGRVDARIELRLESSRGFRGEAITVEGRLVDDEDAPIGDRRVVIWLGAANRDAGAASVRVGELETDETGRFAGDLRIPPTAPLGNAGIYAIFDGDESFRRAISP